MSREYNSDHLPAQMLAAAERLPDEVAREFLRLQSEAASKIIAGMQRVQRGAELRRAAWQLYRNVMLERAGELRVLGFDLDQIAARLGLTERALRQLLDRAARDKYGAAPAGGAR